MACIFFFFFKCKKSQKKQDVSKNMHPCHFFNSNNNKDFIKNLKKSRMFLRTGFVELSNSWKLIAIHNLVWLNSRPVTVQNETLYFQLLSWHFFKDFYQKKLFLLFIFFFFDEVLNFCNRILTNIRNKNM